MNKFETLKNIIWLDLTIHNLYWKGTEEKEKKKVSNLTNHYFSLFLEIAHFSCCVRYILCLLYVTRNHEYHEILKVRKKCGHCIALKSKVSLINIWKIVYSVKFSQWFLRNKRECSKNIFFSRSWLYSQYIGPLNDQERHNFPCVKI